MKSWRNMSILEKAAVLTSTGGQLSTENAEKFIDTVVKQDEILKRVTIQKMDSATRNIDTMMIASRQFRQPTEGSETSNNASASFPRRTLITKETILTPDVSYKFLRENIERAAAEQHLMNKFSEQFANDLVDLAINGDEDSANAFLALNDGWIDLALADSTVNDVDISGSSDWKTNFKKILQGLPQKYRGNKKVLAFLVSPDTELEYRDQIAARNTVLGDRFLVDNDPVYYGGINVVPVPTWPDGYVMLTFWKNLVIGFSREVSVEKERKPRKQMIEYTIASQIDPQYAVGEMISLAAA